MCLYNMYIFMLQEGIKTWLGEREHSQRAATFEQYMEKKKFKDLMFQEIQEFKAPLVVQLSPETSAGYPSWSKRRLQKRNIK